MTPRERFNNALSFQEADRLPIVEWAAWWDKTVGEWHSQGMPVLDFEASLRYFGLDELHAVLAHTVWKQLPPVEEGKGNVSCAADYEKYRDRFFCDEAIGFMCGQLQKLKERHDRGEIIIRMWIDGYFWFPRKMFGIEPHMYAFYDQPELIHRMNCDLAEFNLKAMRACLTVLKPDFVGYAEDMSYNHGPMLSKKQFDEFLLPYYKRVNSFLVENDVRVMVDSDGDVTKMIPWLTAAGIEGVYPLERQAGVDIVEIREKNPRFLMLGGFDKMVMFDGEDAIRREFERILPVMRSGGYIPSMDHQTPPGVTLENYKAYVRLFGEYAKKACK